MTIGDKFYYKTKFGIFFGIINKIDDNFVYSKDEIFGKSEIVVMDKIKNYYLVEICQPAGQESYRINRLIESNKPLDYIEIWNIFSYEENRNITKIEIIRPIN